jgi:prepilin-type N-terminal cleavage/methylation domain-containing protein
MQKLIKRESGFTIIEVVLVLAIAGLIFLVVFLALPQLQESQRDNERRSAVGRAVAAGTSFITDNNGGVATTAAQIAGTFNPSPYTIATDGLSTSTEVMGYADGNICDGSGGITTTGATVRSFAVSLVLENGSTYCQDNQ